MRQSANRNKVHTSDSGLAHGRQGITAGGLNLNGGIGSADECYGPAQSRRVHVVEQNAVWAARYGFLDLCEIFSFHVDRCCLAPRRADGSADAAQQQRRGFP